MKIMRPGGTAVCDVAAPPEALVAASDDERDWFLVASDASSDASTSTSTDGSSVFSTRARVRLEGSRGAFALDNERGGSSGRVAPMVGDAEWSATGRNGAALADLQLHNFTFRAAARCVSRLVEMGGEAYEATRVRAAVARRSPPTQGLPSRPVRSLRVDVAQSLQREAGPYPGNGPHL